MTKSTTKSEKMQKAWRLYEEANEQAPASARQVAAWAVEHGHLVAPRVDPLDVLASDMAKALREQFETDSQGRRYRVNHAVRITKGNVQHTMWAMLDNAPRHYMEQAFYQRREQIVGDCVQLKVDVDVYNDKHGDKPPIPLILDFTDDVEERMEPFDDDWEEAA